MNDYGHPRDPADWPTDPRLVAAYRLARHMVPWIDEPVREDDLMSAEDAGVILNMSEDEIFDLGFSEVGQDGRGGVYVPAREVVELFAARLAS